MKPENEYKETAYELIGLANSWGHASWWRKRKLAMQIAALVWKRRAAIQSALIYHTAGMKAMQHEAKSRL